MALKISNGFKNLTENSFVIIHDDLVNNPSLGLNFWSRGNISNKSLKENQKDYPSLNIRRMKVSDIIKSDKPEFAYIKIVLLDKLRIISIENKIENGQ